TIKMQTVVKIVEVTLLSVFWSWAGAGLFVMKQQALDVPPTRRKWIENYGFWVFEAIILSHYVLAQKLLLGALAFLVGLAIGVQFLRYLSQEFISKHAFTFAAGAFVLYFNLRAFRFMDWDGLAEIMAQHYFR
ncbi:MAG TPA: hypothetical protein VM735_07465, partial [Candidatus Kapabacteria bacterium]|nr:hypothetical protein [Candidatus Kapabacteria bacterium]